DDCLLAAITRAQALGFDPSEIRHRLSALLAAEQVTVPVIFLGGTVAQAARYARDLDRRFAHRSLSFVPYDLSALSADSPSLLDTLRTAWTVVTFVTAVPTVQRFLSRHRIEAEIIGVTAELGA